MDIYNGSDSCGAFSPHYSGTQNTLCSSLQGHGSDRPGMPTPRTLQTGPAQEQMVIFKLNAILVHLLRKNI